jgi:hypothetical protein
MKPSPTKSHQKYSKVVNSQQHQNTNHPVTSRPSPFRFAMLDASEASEGTPTTLDARSAGSGHDQQTPESGAKP